jgi:hypothetical protein
MLFQQHRSDSVIPRCRLQCPVYPKADIGWAIYEYPPCAESFLPGDLILPSPIVFPIFPLGHVSGPTGWNVMHGELSLTKSFRVYKEPESQRDGF